MEEPNKYIELDELLENPSAFTEEEAKNFFSDEDNRTTYIAVLRGLQAERRCKASVPDIEHEWRSFETAHDPTTSNRIRIGYFLSALVGAAAMLIGVLVYNILVPEKRNDNVIVAMDYDPTPQQAIMETEGDGKPVILHNKTISFFSKYQKGLTDKGNAVESSVGDKKRILKSPRGMDLKVILPDGSEVWLNAESSISFPESFNNTRNVIISGEAYFKVVHDSKKPFTVITDKMSVRVLGTEFNMRAYPDGRHQVALMKGSVQVAEAGSDKVDAVLMPGQGASVDKQGRIHVGDIDTYAVKQWKDGFFYFQNQNLLNALQEIGRWYNVGVVFQNTSLTKVKLHFSALRKESLSKTIEKLNLLLGTNIEVKDHNIIVK